MLSIRNSKILGQVHLVCLIWPGSLNRTEVYVHGTPLIELLL